MATGPDTEGRATGKIFDDVRDHQFELFRVDADFRRQILPVLQRVEREIVETLRRIDPTDPRRQSFRVRRLEAVLAETRKIIRGGYAAMRGATERNLSQLAEVEAGIAKEQLREGLAEIDVRAAFASASKEQIDAIVGRALVEGNRLKDFWLNGWKRLDRRVANELRAGLAQGESIRDLTRRLRGGTKDGVVIPGVMRGTRREVEGIVRTSVASVANDARLATFRENEDILSAVQHSSTLDNRTTDICIARDGKRWTLDGKPIGHSIPFDAPPVHFNCRSVLIPIVRGADEIKGTRASQFGEVPADETFQEFLERREKRTPGFTDQLLGPGRADLWRRGKITTTDLLDFKGDPMTLEQLRAKFDRAA